MLNQILLFDENTCPKRAETEGPEERWRTKEGGFSFPSVINATTAKEWQPYQEMQVKNIKKKEGQEMERLKSAKKK